MDGVTMIKALRADARTQNVLILMLTSGNSIEDETRGLTAGADDYVLKPVEPRRLVARIKTLLARSKRRQFTDAKSEQHDPTRG
jgi:DNA-binding response OmpR family regulator